MFYFWMYKVLIHIVETKVSLHHAMEHNFITDRHAHVIHKHNVAKWKLRNAERENVNTIIARNCKTIKL